MKLDVITTAFAATLIQLSFVTTSNRKGRAAWIVIVQAVKRLGGLRGPPCLRAFK